MHLIMRSGVVAKGFEVSPGDVVDWKDEAEAKRLIETGVASAASKEEIHNAGNKVKTYIPPKPNPEDKWAPRQLKELPRDYGEEAREARRSS